MTAGVRFVLSSFPPLFVSCHGRRPKLRLCVVSGIHAQAADILPDDFSYLMAIKACTAGLWSGSSWDKVDGWGNQDRDTSATPQPLPNFESKVEHHGEDTPRCRGEFALEVGLFQANYVLRVTICSAVKDSMLFVLTQAVSLRYHLPHSRLTKSPAQSGPILVRTVPIVNDFTSKPVSVRAHHLTTLYHALWRPPSEYSY